MSYSKEKKKVILYYSLASFLNHSFDSLMIFQMTNERIFLRETSFIQQCTKIHKTWKFE